MCSIRKISALFSAVALSVTVMGSNTGDRTVWLDEIDSQGYYVQDWGSPQINR